MHNIEREETTFQGDRGRKRRKEKTLNSPLYRPRVSLMTNEAHVKGVHRVQKPRQITKKKKANACSNQSTSLTVKLNNSLLLLQKQECIGIWLSTWIFVVSEQ